MTAAQSRFLATPSLSKKLFDHKARRNNAQKKSEYLGVTTPSKGRHGVSCRLVSQKDTGLPTMNSCEKKEKGQVQIYVWKSGDEQSMSAESNPGQALVYLLSLIRDKCW